MTPARRRPLYHRDDFRRFAGRLKSRLVDRNGDGWRDLIVSAFINGKRRERVYDGLTFAPPSARLG